MGRSIGIPKHKKNGPKPQSCKTKHLAAGDFSPWLNGMLASLRGKRGSDVPCGDCTACCTSSQFIHIGPEETDTLSRIPKRLLFPAPLLPKGHVLLGYDKQSRCPMLGDHGCSIYEHRPRTCRTYDCRVFTAAGLSPDEDKPRIVRQAKRWKFNAPTMTQKNQHNAVRAAATFFRRHKDLLPVGIAPSNATQLAVLAIRIHGTFLSRDSKTNETSVIKPEVDKVLSVLKRLDRRKPLK